MGYHNLVRRWLPDHLCKSQNSWHTKKQAVRACFFRAGAESVLYGKFWILMQKTLLDRAADCHPVQYFLILNT